MDRHRRLAILALALLAALAPVGAGSAAAVTLPAAEAPLVEEDEAEPGEGDAEPCEAGDQAAEEACEEALEASEEAEAEAEEAEQCRLGSAAATVTAVPARNQLRLTVRYRTVEPSAVVIHLRLRGGRGGLDLGTESAHFGRSGTLRTSERLTDPQMTRALAAREFTVAIQAVDAPRFCGAELERHLTARKGSGGGLQWSEPTAARHAREARAARV